MDNQQRYQAARKVSLISALTNLLLAIGKVILGWIGHSHALIADGIHSFSDLLSDALVLIAAKAAGAVPDKEHPYGHQRIETLGAIIIAIMLIFVALAIAYESASNLINQTAGAKPEFIVLVMAFISIIANEWLFRYTRRVGEAIDSQLLISNAWHSRSDALSSIIVFVSVIGSMLGFHYLDSIAAILIAVFILKMGISMMYNGVNELIDAGVDAATLTDIQQTIATVPGVVAVHQLRTRTHGSKIFIDVHIIVAPFISVSEGHHIGQQVHTKLENKVPNIADVTVHIDPEDDESAMPSVDLPDRNTLLIQLNNIQTQLPHFAQLHNFIIHYLDGKLHLEFVFPRQYINELKTLEQHYQIVLTELNDVSSICILVADKSSVDSPSDRPD